MKSRIHLDSLGALLALLAFLLQDFSIINKPQCYTLIAIGLVLVVFHDIKTEDYESLALFIFGLLVSFFLF